MNTILATVAALMILALTLIVGYIFIALMGWVSLVMDEVKSVAKGA